MFFRFYPEMALSLAFHLLSELVEVRFMLMLNDSLFMVLVCYLMLLLLLLFRS